MQQIPLSLSPTCGAEFYYYLFRTTKVNVAVTDRVLKHWTRNPTTAKLMEQEIPRLVKQLTRGVHGDKWRSDDLPHRMYNGQFEIEEYRIATALYTSYRVLYVTDDKRVLILAAGDHEHAYGKWPCRVKWQAGAGPGTEFRLPIVHLHLTHEEEVHFDGILQRIYDGNDPKWTKHGVRRHTLPDASFSIFWNGAARRAQLAVLAETDPYPLTPVDIPNVTSPYRQYIVNACI
jgi:hypothetical protein